MFFGLLRYVEVPSCAAVAAFCREMLLMNMSLLNGLKVVEFLIRQLRE